MIGSRRGRPSLIGRAAGTAARTAVITKTATTVAGSSAAKQQAKMHSAELAHAEKMAAVAPAMAAQPATAAPPAGDGLEMVRKLVGLRESGLLDDAEFFAKVKQVVG